MKVERVVVVTSVEASQTSIRIDGDMVPVGCIVTMRSGEIELRMPMTCAQSKEIHVGDRFNLLLESA